MQTKLDSLLESIDPALTVDRVSERIDDALNSFEIENGIITNWETFRIVLTNFFRHTENRILRIKAFESTNSDIDWGRCVRLLLKEYGPTGDKAAFEMVRTGNQGGLYKVLKDLAKQMLTQYSDNEAKARISYFWSSLSIDEKFATADEYLAKYGHLLPPELTESNAARIKANFVKVLEEHPKLINRMRSVSG